MSAPAVAPVLAEAVDSVGLLQQLLLSLQGLAAQVEAAIATAQRERAERDAAAIRALDQEAAAHG